MFFIFTKSHNFKSPCRATSTFKKYLRKPINSYNDINNIFVNANLLLCFPQAQPGGTVKGQHGSSGFRHMGTFNGKQQLLVSSYPRYPHPSQHSRGSSASGWWELGRAKVVAASLVWVLQQRPCGSQPSRQAAPRPTQQRKPHPCRSYL